MAFPDEEVPFNLDKAFFKKLAEEKQTLTNYIENGTCKDFGDYRFYTGQLIGIKIAERVFKDIVSAWENR